MGTVLLASWLVVGVSLAILYRKGLEYGLNGLGAAALAVPATFVPAWQFWAALRPSRGIIGALTGHLWVLNGSVGYAVLALTVMGVWDLMFLGGGPSSWLVALAGATGFLLLSAGLMGFNLWLFRGRLRRSQPPEAPGERAGSAPGPAAEGQTS